MRRRACCHYRLRECRTSFGKELGAPHRCVSGLCLRTGTKLCAALWIPRCLRRGVSLLLGALGFPGGGTPPFSAPPSSSPPPPPPRAAAGKGGGGRGRPPRHHPLQH